MEEGHVNENEKLLREVAQKYHAPEPGQVQILKRRSGLGLRYTSHSTVTKVLNEIDPWWSFEPVLDRDGIPYVEERNGMLTMYGHLTVLSKDVFCIGSCDNSKADWAKELYGDALRNGAMRLGIHLALWEKDFPEAAAVAETPATTGTASNVTSVTTTWPAKVQGMRVKVEDVAPVTVGPDAATVPTGAGVLAEAAASMQEALGAAVITYTCGGQPERFAQWPGVKGCGKQMEQIDANVVMRTKTYLCEDCHQKWVESVGGPKKETQK